MIVTKSKTSRKWLTTINNPDEDALPADLVEALFKAGATYATG